MSAEGGSGKGTSFCDGMIARSAISAFGDGGGVHMGAGRGD